jgi:hypothetical protein
MKILESMKKLWKKFSSEKTEQKLELERIKKLRKT